MYDYNTRRLLLLATTITLALFDAIRAELRDKREIIGVVPSKEIAIGDAEVSATTGFAGAAQAANKYFQDIYSAQLKPHQIEFGHVRETPDEWEQRFERVDLKKAKHQGKVLKMKFANEPYVHVPASNLYEFGHKRGNDDHFTERHEKGDQQGGEFKTKVRWGDKRGGYGEHYWDYNHAGRGGDDGDDYAESNVEEEVVEYDKSANRVGNVADGRRKRQSLVGTRIRGDDVEFINEGARDLILSGVTGRHGGNYRREPGLSNRAKRDDGSDKGSFLWYPALDGGSRKVVDNADYLYLIEQPSAK